MIKNNIQILIRTWFRGQLVGQDVFGNRYYQDKRFDRDQISYNKRWVIYSNEAEASCVSAAWHGWLHHNCDVSLESKTLNTTINLQKNMTGTSHAYFPPSINQDGKLAKSDLKRYESWQPDKK